jgi:nitrogenase molybdenum-iron protein NifN
MPRSKVTLDLTLPGRAKGAREHLESLGVRSQRLRLPIGIRATDAFCGALTLASGRPPAAWVDGERGRLLDAYADGHKYVFGKRVALFGDPELVVGMAEFLLEVGAVPVLVATGARNQALSRALAERGDAAELEVLEDTDFSKIEAACQRLKPDLILGNSKGYRAARSVGAPLLRVGFPIHDRVGAGRMLQVGYRGTMRLFDSIINTLLERQQDASPVGFSYL